MLRKEFMQFHNPAADLFVPDGLEMPAALARTTHLAIAAHQDDLEIMAYHGIAACFGQREQWFTGVIVTNGAGSPRAGIYGGYTDEEMQQVRRTEQRKAAFVGEYACQAQLGFTSAQVKDAVALGVTANLRARADGADAWRRLFGFRLGRLPGAARAKDPACLPGIHEQPNQPRIAESRGFGFRQDAARPERRLRHHTGELHL
jgi:hypothetical protein